MRNLADAMPLAHFRRVEGLLNRAKIADGDIGRLHLRHPVFAQVACTKIPCEYRAQLIPVGRTGTRVANSPLATDRPVEHFDHQAADTAGHWRRPCKTARRTPS